jgi:signal transduction histidine kinase
LKAGSFVSKVDKLNENYYQNFMENKVATKKLLHLYQRQQQFSYHLYKKYEEEKASVASQLHASLGQSLVLLKLTLQYVGSEKFGHITTEKIAGLVSQVDGLIADIRQITTSLRPGILDDFGLFTALSWQSDEFGKESGIRTVFECRCNELRLSRFSETMLFRAYQELLTNVKNHAGASKIVTVLETTGTHLQLTVIDNGKGFDMPKPFIEKPFGIQSIQERAMAIGGASRIYSSPGTGTSVIISVPLPDQYANLPVDKEIESQD